MVGSEQLAVPVQETGDASILREELIAALNRKIDAVLGPLLPPGSSCALLDFPNHNNPGDNAMWLGTVSYLRRRGLRIRYVCDVATYDHRCLTRRLRKGGVIICHGGGNFGDLYPVHQRFRERVISECPDHQVVLMPQTIHFKDPGSLQRAKQVLEGHSNLTILARDQRSFEIASSAFRAPSWLCPDIAFALGPIRRPTLPSREIVWALRSDVEVLREPLPSLEEDAEQVQWLDPSYTRLDRINRFLHRRMAEHSRDLKDLSVPFGWVCELLARRRVAHGCRMLSRGQVVVTDFMHGHILSVLLGVAHVLLDNSYGKSRRLYQTWTAGCELARWADSPAEALVIARELVHTSRGGGEHVALRHPRYGAGDWP